MARYEFEANRVSGDGNAIFPDKIIIDTDEELVIFRKPKLIGSTEIKVCFDAIASVSCDKHVLFADIVIETRGGRCIVAHGFTRSDANEIVELLSL